VVFNLFFFFAFPIFYFFFFFPDRWNSWPPCFSLFEDLPVCPIRFFHPLDFTASSQVVTTSNVLLCARFLPGVILTRGTVQNLGQLLRCSHVFHPPHPSARFARVSFFKAPSDIRYRTTKGILAFFSPPVLQSPVPSPFRSSS